MRVYVIIASINPLSNVSDFKNDFLESGHDVKVIVIDEGDDQLRELNKKLLGDFNFEFYGVRERVEWFKSRFGSSFKSCLPIIPERCHAETSFGFLVAFEEKADVIIELDDDVKPVGNQSFVDLHVKNLYENDAKRVCPKNGKWYNTIENMDLNVSYKIFPRGHPYNSGDRTDNYAFAEDGGKCILNMGLWVGSPDLDALSILYYGGLKNGKCHIKSLGLKRDKVIVDTGTYFAVCSMNTSFKREIIPAFYQLYMNHMGIDRFDDIWAGIFLKKISDHLGKKVCLGAPLVYHDKRSRDVFKDLKAELDGMAINEYLWKIVDEIELSEEDYFECYRELANGIKRKLDVFPEKHHRDFLKLQVEKMNGWLKVVQKIE